MKVLVVFLLLLSFTACGKLENFTNLSRQKIETEPGELEQPNAPPILEITLEAKGLWDVTGKTLFLNLYENGIVEFEYEDDAKRTPGKNSYKTEEINSLARAKISEDELRKFNDLLRSDDLQNVRNEYQRICDSVDAFTDYKINFQNARGQKNIILYNYCGSSGVRNPGQSNMLDFPKVLSDLLDLAELTRAKYYPRKISR